MRGRSVTFEVMPLAFREFLAFREIPVDAWNTRAESRVRAAFEEYLHWGGFPEIVLAEPAMRPLILEEYASLLLYRDLVERHGIRNEPAIRALLRHAFRHTSSLLSVSKLHRDLVSQGLELSRNTLFEYLGFLEDAGLVFLLPKQDVSIRKQMRNPRKLHVVDPGLISAYKAGAERDMGHKLETVVYLECRRRTRDWFYQSGAAELDLCDAAGTAFIKVCWDLADPATAAREATAMRAGASAMPGAAGALLYHEFAPAVADRFPDAQPAWRWLLETHTDGPRPGRRGRLSLTETPHRARR
jgi:hypothetical protein